MSRGHDVTTPEQLVAALLDKPLCNTAVSLVHFDMPRLAQMEVMMAASAVGGSASIRHALFQRDGGLMVQQHADVSPQLHIPAAYIQRVQATLAARSEDAPTLTGVSWQGSGAPVSVATSRNWASTSRTTSTASASAGLGQLPVVDDVDTLPFSVMYAASLDVELLRCNLCDRLFRHVGHYTAHKCAMPVSSPRMFERGCAAAYARSGGEHVGRSRAAEAGVDASAGVAHPAPAMKLQYGWARPPPRDVEHVDEQTTALITAWFNEGQASGKTKCSAAMAVQRLRQLRDPETGQLVYEDEDALPTEKRIKRLFSTLAQQERAANRIHTAC